MNSPARFLVLSGAAPRATLFDCDRHLLGEVIEDDGFIVDRLMVTARYCPLPGAEMLEAMVPPPSPHWPVRCYELCEERESSASHPGHARAPAVFAEPAPAPRSEP